MIANSEWNGMKICCINPLHFFFVFSCVGGLGGGGGDGKFGGLSNPRDEFSFLVFPVWRVEGGVGEGTGRNSNIFSPTDFFYCFYPSPFPLPPSPFPPSPPLPTSPFPTVPSGNN